MTRSRKPLAFLLGAFLLPFMAHSFPAHGAPKRKPIPNADELKKLPKDGGPEFNRLVFEKSPYLLQHAGNPVDWYPWGEEAFATAKKDGKPIFLSVGYATCHWCHVMEHESFEDAEVAKLMNDKFVCIKVDREELPHIDQVYMTFTQAATGSGGWPMNVIMTADQKPFFAGTYFPKASLTRLIANIDKAWTEDREKLIGQANDMAQRLREFSKGGAGGDLDAKALELAYSHYSGTFDSQHGGFAAPPRYAPKFPTPHEYSFLLRYARRTGEAKALKMVEESLTAMRLGGLYDQVGFGTHRYSTDREWLTPHFEKMLYDQALLAIAHVEAHQATGKAIYRQTAEEIFTYALRDMMAPEGAFHSAEDADSEGEEGKFYVWTLDEVKKVLGDEEGEFYGQTFGFTKEGNFKEEASGEKSGANIPHLKKPLTAEEAKRVEEARRKLFEVRAKRVHPLKDDKILTDWNGLMIAALAQGGVAFGDAKWTEAAKKAADFLLAKMVTKEGRLLKRFREGEAGLVAHLEDYAFLTWGLLNLYEATFDPKYLKSAKDFTGVLLNQFWDKESGGFFMTAHDTEELILRSKDAYDGAIPSGNAVAAMNLLRLARMTGETDYEEKAKQILRAFSGGMKDSAGGHAMMMQALDFLTGETREIVVVGKRDAEDTKAMLAAIQRRFDPNKVVIFKEDGPSGEAISAIAPYVKDHSSMEGKATVYVCRNFACQLPTTDLAKVKEMIEPKKK